MRHSNLIAFTSLLLYSLSGLAQVLNIGTPGIKNFTPEEYKANPHNWKVDITENGIILFANNDGLLTFNNEDWQLYQHKNKTIARSVSVFNNNLFAVGGQDEIGYLQPGVNGVPTFSSVLDFMNGKIEDVEDVWNLYATENSLYVQINHSIFSIQDSTIINLHANIAPSFLLGVGDEIYYNNGSKEIYHKEPASEPKLLVELPDGLSPIDLLPLEDNTFLLMTLEQGVYRISNGVVKKWESNASAYLIDNQILSSCKLKNGNIAIGTRLGGLLILDEMGKCLYVLSKDSGLQSTSINDIAEDQNGDLWLASYYGIDKVILSTHETFFSPDNDLEGPVYDIELWNNKWWFATSNGLYYIQYQDYYDPFQIKNFEAIPELKGQVWGLDLIDDHMYVAHHKGAFELKKNNQVSQIDNLFGAWSFKKLRNDAMIMGSYFGLHQLELENNQWKESKKLAGFDESSRILALDQNENLWVSHPYRGVYKFNFVDNYSSFTMQSFSTDDRFKAEYDNYIFEVGNNAMIVNNLGTFAYDNNSQDFVSENEISNLLKHTGRIRKLISKDNDIWYITENETGVISPSGTNGELVKKSLPNVKSNYVGGFEFLYPLDHENQFLCTNKGIIYHHEAQSDSLMSKVYIASISLNPNDSIVYGYMNTDNQLDLKTSENSFRINFRDSRSLSEDLEGFSYRLLNYNDQWSNYTNRANKEYANLKSGNYTFEIKSKNAKGNISETTRLDIKIKTPWHQTIWAFILYTLLLIVILSLFVIIPNKKYKEETKKLEIKQKESEEELEKVKEEKLLTEIQYKNKELASTTLQLVQKNQTINTLRTEINALQKKMKDDSLKDDLKNMVSVLRDDLKLEDDWDKFSMSFDQVHNDFFKRLKQEYPQLKKNDQELCGYLKMNLSTKEIAPLLGISVRGVEIRRYRLRKKLNMDTSVNLNEFMTSF